ncbi:hypothetical protein BKA67DRAFT_500397, partial [Truncatella angustata]
MPPATAAAAKKQPLTLDQISKYDDILTDCLVDQTFFHSTIPKNRTTYHPSRGLREEEITKVIQQHLIVEPNLDLAASKLLAITGLRKFHDALKTDKEKDDFRKHLRRYAQIYLPDCPFEVSTTNRYTIVTYEAAVTARRFIKRGDPIKYLSGIQVLITAKEEEEMTKRKKDFSIVVSSRNKCASLFMGPARFANHDCDANARLVITSQSTIEIFATKNIEIGDEITVTYGENYFGEDNRECLCHSCENSLSNGWAQPEGEGLQAGLVQKSIEEPADEGYRLRRRRRDDSSARSSRSQSRTPDIRPRVARSRTNMLRTGSSRTSMTGSPAPEALLRQKRKREMEMLSSPPATPAKRQKSDQVNDTPVPAPDQIVRRNSEGSVSLTDSIMSASDSGSGELTDVTTPEEDTKEAEFSLQSPNPTPKKTELKIEGSGSMLSIFGAGAFGASRQPTIANLIHSDESVSATGIPAANIPNASAEVNIIHPEDLKLMVIPPPLTPASKPAEQISSTPGAAVKIPAPSKHKSAKTELCGSPEPTSDDEMDEREAREPGDYTLTPLLLAEPNSAWIGCRVCEDYFVQQDAYFTRAYCPRCERHSKLYGYQWPKTQREGKHDKEERIMDHREIHRFLDSRDEARVRGRK